MTQGTDQPDWIYTLAEKVGAALFVNGNGDEAIRLMLELPNGRYGGGWSRNPACDEIDRVLRAELAALRQRAELAEAEASVIIYEIMVSIPDWKTYLPAMIADAPLAAAAAQVLAAAEEVHDWAATDMLTPPEPVEGLVQAVDELRRLRAGK